MYEDTKGVSWLLIITGLTGLTITPGREDNADGDMRGVQRERKEKDCWK